MKSTRLFLLASLLVAMIYATGAALAGVPNIELITTLTFVSGYLLGAGLGALVGACGMAAHSLFNPFGAAAPPMLAAQIICFALIGLVGGTVGPRIARAKHRKRAMIVSAALGVILVVIYLTVVSVAGFYAFATNVNLWVYLWAGIAFAAVQVVWNAVVFGVAVPPMLRVLARQRRQLHSATTRDVGQKP